MSSAPNSLHGFRWPGSGHVNFDEYPDPPIQGDPAHLVAAWRAKLALTSNPRGHIAPLRQ